MTDVIEQVKAAEEKADRIWQEVYGEKGDERAREPEAPKSEVEPEDNYIPIMTFQLGEQGRKISQLEEKITELSRFKEEPKPETKHTEEHESVRYFKTEYPDIADGVQELVKSMVGQLENEVDTKLKKVDQDVTKVNEDTVKKEKNTFLASLDGDKEIGEDWRTINNDPEFIESLQEIEPYSGRIKHELLMDAFNGMDTERTARFFRDFQKGKTAPKLDTERPNDAPIVTRQDLRRFYEDVRTGRWIGREKEAGLEEIRLIKGLGVQVKQ
ncbi:MAG: hypothetical protein FJ115_04780 [Deltaproteobacteria bacterium]|nr:hypothetical protein [Deltaproteobacteria bacterium]MBM4322858.1 hypothetical protein [Deltaproteobacteria bacterium]